MSEREVFVYPIYWQGEDTYVPVDFMDRSEKEFWSRAEKLHKKLSLVLDQNTYLIERLQKDEGYLGKAIDSLGFLMARAVNSKIKPVDTRLAGAAKSSLTGFEFVIQRRDGTKIPLALRNVNDTFGKLQTEIDTQISERQGAKVQAAAVVSVLVAAASFAVLAVYATRGAAVKMGMGPVKSAMAGNGFAAAIQSATNELGKLLDGTSKGAGDALLNITQDTALAIMTGGLAAKLPKAAVDLVADKLAWKLALRFKFLGGDRAYRIAHNWLVGPGVEAGKQAMASIAKMVSDAALKGKVPSEADAQKMLVDMMIAVFLRDAMKVFERFDSNFTTKALQFLKNEKVPARLRDAIAKHKDEIAEAAKKASRLKDLCKPVAKGAEFDGICREVAEAVYGESVKQAMGIGFETLSKGGSEGQAMKGAEAELAKDADVQKAIDAEVKKSLKKRGVKM
jgi:hypothetical protein